jgi:hypothetical protein
MMASRRLADYVASQQPVLKLPHPYLTAYRVQNGDGPNLFQLKAVDNSADGAPILGETSVQFTEPEDLRSGDRPGDSNNTAWARARRSPLVNLHWTQDREPAIAAVWLVVYVIFTIRTGEEFFRLKIHGSGAESLATQLKTVALAVDDPKRQQTAVGRVVTGGAAESCDELLVLRGSFWQGAGSPFGSRPIWVLDDPAVKPEHRISSFPLTPLDYTMTANPPATMAWHPRRPAKPRPGSVIYSRYIPHLAETFSMVALDYRDEEHVRLFHQWQNDPRVSQGWNQTGTLDQHREYLRHAHEDPHQLPIMARFEDTYFAYFEVYWAKVRCSHLGLLYLYPSLADSLDCAGGPIRWLLQSRRL